MKKEKDRFYVRLNYTSLTTDGSKFDYFVKFIRSVLGCSFHFIRCDFITVLQNCHILKQRTELLLIVLETSTLHLRIDQHLCCKMKWPCVCLLISKRHFRTEILYEESKVLQFEMISSSHIRKDFQYLVFETEFSELIPKTFRFP